MRKITTIIIFLSAITVFGLEACSGGGQGGSDKGKSKKEKKSAEKKEKEEKVPQSIKEGKGVGPVDEVKVADKINEDWAENGEAIHGKKCASCHKLTDKRATGPGWAGITNRRKPEWIMNMIMDTEAMLAQDPTARKQLAKCATRMPNQNLTRKEARHVLEFMRKNDLEKTGKKDQAMKSS